MKTIAVIPIRTGSRRCPGKNAADFLGEALFVRKIRQLKEAGVFSDILVTSDSMEWLATAQQLGCSVLIRPKEHCDDKSVPFGETIAYVCENIPASEFDHVFWTPCTSPLTMPEHYREAFALYDTMLRLQLQNDSLVSVAEFKHYLLDDDGPLNYDLSNGFPISQSLRPLYAPTNAIWAAPREKMIRWKSFHGPKPAIYRMEHPFTVDIDTQADFDYALHLASRYKLT